MKSLYRLSDLMGLYQAKLLRFGHSLESADSLVEKAFEEKGLKSSNYLEMSQDDILKMINKFEENMNVSETILQQLGGNKFVVMTGSKNFIASENGLTFQLTRNHAKAKYCKITLNSMDLYDMEFYKLKKGELVKVAERNGLYNSMLQSMFTDVTQLYTSL